MGLSNGTGSLDNRSISRTRFLLLRDDHPRRSRSNPAADVVPPELHSALLHCTAAVLLVDDGIQRVHRTVAERLALECYLDSSTLVRILQFTLEGVAERPR